MKEKKKEKKKIFVRMRTEFSIPASATIHDINVRFKRTLELQMRRKCVTYQLLTTISRTTRNRDASLY